MIQKPKNRRINFTYNSEYWHLLCEVSACLEIGGYEPNEDFIWRDSGHTLEVDENAHFDLKESPEWQELMRSYEAVGDLYVRRLR